MKKTYAIMTGICSFGATLLCVGVGMINPLPTTLIVSGSCILFLGLVVWLSIATTD